MAFLFDQSKVASWTVQFLVFANCVAGFTLLVQIIDYANDTLPEVYAGFPRWFIAMLAGIVVTGVGFLAYRKMRESDILKYEFVDVVTHKFRTPLTYIRWSLDSLRSTHLEKGQSETLAMIDEANVRLSDLTNTLVGLSEGESSRYLYEFSPENVRDIVNDVLGAVAPHSKQKDVSMRSEIPNDLPAVLVDRRRTEFILQTILENAIIYSSQRSSILIAASADRKYVKITIHDSGIGIAKADLLYIFSRFYRTSNATLVHTEGLGLGLYLAKEIATRQGGNIRVESEGLGKGSTFVVELPKV